jgi:hypothetical protein
LTLVGENYKGNKYDIESECTIITGNFILYISKIYILDDTVRTLWRQKGIQKHKCQLCREFYISRTEQDRVILEAGKRRLRSEEDRIYQRIDRYSNLVQRICKKNQQNALFFH